MFVSSRLAFASGFLLLLGRFTYAAPGDLAPAEAHRASHLVLRGRPWTDREAVIELVRRNDTDLNRAFIEQLSEADPELVASGELVLEKGAPVEVLRTIGGAFRPGAESLKRINRFVLARVFLRLAQTRNEVPPAVRGWAAQQLTFTKERQVAAVQSIVAAHWIPGGPLPWAQWQVPAAR